MSTASSPRRASAHPNSSAAPAEVRWLGRWFTQVRRSGLLAQTPPAAWHTLSALLSFTTREGRHPFSLEQLAFALGVPAEEARRRLDELPRTPWHGQPLATPLYDTAGELVGAEVVPVELLDQVRPAEPETTPPAEALGTLISPELHLALEAVGLVPAQVERLTELYPEHRIRRQLSWLPQRKARNPAALLLAAIEQDWEAPREEA